MVNFRVAIAIQGIFFLSGHASAQTDHSSPFSSAVKLGIFKFESSTKSASCPVPTETRRVRDDVCSKLSGLAKATDEMMPFRTGAGHFCSAFWESSGFYKTKNSCPVPSKTYGDEQLIRSKVAVKSKVEIQRFIDRRKSSIAALCCTDENCRKFMGDVEIAYSENAADRTEYSATYLSDENGEPLVPDSGFKAGRMKLMIEKTIERRKGRFQFDSSTIDHELIHACQDFKAQQKAAKNPAFLTKRFQVTQREKRCDIGTLDSWVAYYKSFDDPLISNPELLGCFANLARQAVSQNTPFPHCSTTCSREQLEEAINIYQEIRWAILSPDKMTNSFVPEFCESLRDSNHPAGADVLDCAIRHDPIVKANLDLQFHCQ